MARSRGLFVGRGGERALLERVLDDTVEGVAGTVIVSGEPGIGKSQLLWELAQIAETRGCLVLEGTAAEFEMDLPFEMFRDALDDYLRTLDEASVERLAVDRQGELAAVFPSLGRLQGSVEHPPSVSERYRVHYAVRNLLERLAARHPLALLFDDVHWADSGSLELIEFLVRRPPDAPVILCLAARAATGAPGAMAVIDDLRSRAAVVGVELAPMTLPELGQLVMLRNDQDLARLHQASGGNPFFALQLAETIGDGPFDVTDAGWQKGAVPTAVTAAIRTELAPLSPAAHRFVVAAAIVGDPFDIDLVAEIAAQAEEQAWSCLDELVARDLVRVSDVPRRFQFRHPLVRSAVYTGCAPSVLVAGHRRMVVALTMRGASPAALAGHVEQSARYGDVEAVELLRRAGDDVTLQAPASAARWYAAALRLLPADGSHSEQRLALLGSLALAQAAKGRFAEAHAVLEEAIELMAEAPVGSRLALVVSCSEVEQLLGHHREALARLQREYEQLDESRSPAAAALLISMSAASLYLADHQGMLDWARHAVEAAEQLGDDVLLGAALAAEAMGAVFAGDADLANSLHDRAAMLVDALDDDAISNRLDALCGLAMAELYLDRYLEGCGHGERALALARATGKTQLLPILTPSLGMSLAMTGHMARSAEVLDDAIEAARIAGNAQGLSMNLFNRALAAIMSGDIETALVAGAESVAVARSVDNGVITAFAGAIQAEAMLEAGDPAGAVRLLLDSVGGEQIPLLAGGWRAHFLELVTRCNLELGQLDDASTAADRCRDLARATASSLAGLMADRAQAAVSLARGDPEAAAKLALCAVDRGERTGAKVHAAASRSLAGRALATAGRREEAVAQLERAAADFEIFGGLRYRDQAEAELRKLGCTVHRRTRRGAAGGIGLESLTGREREVTDLIRDRRTNREIAEMLFLSTKTVETHISNVFHKLGVSRRAEVARVLEQEADPPSTSLPARQ